MDQIYQHNKFAKHFDSKKMRTFLKCTYWEYAILATKTDSVKSLINDKMKEKTNFFMNLTYTLLQMINEIKNKNVIIAKNDNLCLKMSVILVI